MARNQGLNWVLTNTEYITLIDAVHDLKVEKKVLTELADDRLRQIQQLQQQLRHEKAQRLAFDQSQWQQGTFDK